MEIGKKSFINLGLVILILLIAILVLKFGVQTPLEESQEPALDNVEEVVVVNETNESFDLLCENAVNESENASCLYLEAAINGSVENVTEEGNN